MHQYSWLLSVGLIAGIWPPQPTPSSLLKMTPADPAAVASTCPAQPEFGDLEAMFTSRALTPALTRSSPAGAVAPAWQPPHFGVKMRDTISVGCAQVVLSTVGGIGPGAGRGAEAGPGMTTGGGVKGAASGFAGARPGAVTGPTAIGGAPASTKKMNRVSSRRPGQP